MGATTIPLTDGQARAVAKASRKWLTFPGDVRIKVIDAYCQECGGTWVESQEIDCSGDEGHTWIGAALIPLNDENAFSAVKAAAVAWPGRFEIDVLEVYCFAGETEFLTRDGVRTFADCAGTSQMVLTQHFAEAGQRARSRSDGRWVEAEIQSFGEQRLLRVTLVRDGIRKVIRTTPQHRWYAAKTSGRQYTPRELTTAELRPGMVLASLTPRDNIRQSTPSTFGIAHGVVYGDGSLKNARGVAQGSRVDLWGEKDAQLICYFNDMPMTPMKTPNGSGVQGVRLDGLPGYFRSRPSLDESIPYLYGWLAGYFAADGTVSTAGQATLSSASRDDLEFVRAVADRLGIPTSTIATHLRYGLGQDEPSDLHRVTLMRSKLRPEFFLIREHRDRFLAASEAAYDRLHWWVESVEDHGEAEEVFCAVVPDTHTFALADYIWTHNCDACHRPYQAVAARPCEAAVSNEHLRGGPIGTRASRKHDHDCDAAGCPGPGKVRASVMLPLARQDDPELVAAS